MKIEKPKAIVCLLIKNILENFFALILKEQKKLEEGVVECFNQNIIKVSEILNKNTKMYYNVSCQLPKHLCMVLYGKNFT